jgi:DNA polymerase III psi subunit
MADDKIEDEEDFDFSGLGQEIPPALKNSFEFTVFADQLPDSPELLTAKIAGETVERLLSLSLEQLTNLKPEKLDELGDKARGWEDIRAEFLAYPHFEQVRSAALDSFTENMHAVSRSAVGIALGYSMAWALIPVLEQAGGNAFRADFISNMIQAVFDRVVGEVLQLRSAIDQRLDERVGSTMD